MEFSKVIKERFSVRDFKDTPIADDVLEAILEAGRIAPTAVNYQPQRVYVLKSAEAVAKIRSLTRCAFNAPVVLMVGYDKNEEWHNPLEKGVTSGEQDACIVATQMMLRAWDLGIGSCWVGYFPVTETAKAFGLPDNERLVMLLPIGYAADGAGPSPRHAQKKAPGETVRTL